MNVYSMDRRTDKHGTKRGKPRVALKFPHRTSRGGGSPPDGRRPGSPPTAFFIVDFVVVFIVGKEHSGFIVG
jgi:hypothetical protein